MPPRKFKTKEVAKAIKMLMSCLEPFEEDLESEDLAIAPVGQQQLHAGFADVVLGRMRDLESGLHTIYRTVLLLGGIKFMKGITRKELKSAFRGYKRELTREIEDLVKMLKDIWALGMLATSLRRNDRKSYKVLLVSFEHAFQRLKKLRSHNLERGSSEYLKTFRSAIAAVRRAGTLSRGDEFKDEAFPDLQDFMKLLDERTENRGEQHINYVEIHGEMRVEDAEVGSEEPMDTDDEGGEADV